MPSRTRDLALTRRTLLTSMGALGVSVLAPTVSQARQSNTKLVVVILRGAMDGLAAVPKINDPHIRSHRPNLIPHNTLALRDGFALHPNLVTVHKNFDAGDAAIVHALAGPWRDRSHFKAQDLLESGTEKTVLKDGWLNRALQVSPAPLKAVSIGPAQPLILRGKAQAASWSPAVLPEANEDTVNRLLDLYADDPLLGPALAEAIKVDQIAGDAAKGIRGNQYVAPMGAAGRLIAADDGPDIAVVSLGGWDTHANQNGVLGNRLRQLDLGLSKLKQELGTHWSKSAIVVVTEFGRTVRQNGGRGTDHGTGGVGLVLGGAVKGGRILGEWPGLATNQLYQNRDLYPANDMRGLLANLLREQFGFRKSDLTRSVFPDSQGVRMIEAI